MKAQDCFDLLAKDIHTAVAATVGGDGLPVTCAIDIMDCGKNCLYFLTATTKNFYRRLKERGYIAITGIKGADTMSAVAVSVYGKVRETDKVSVKELFDKNPYMYEIYPDEESRKIIRVFQVYSGTCNWFDLSVKPADVGAFCFGEE